MRGFSWKCVFKKLSAASITLGNSYLSANWQNSTIFSHAISINLFGYKYDNKFSNIVDDVSNGTILAL